LFIGLGYSNILLSNPAVNCWIWKFYFHYFYNEKLNSKSSDLISKTISNSRISLYNPDLVVKPIEEFR